MLHLASADTHKLMSRVLHRWGNARSPAYGTLSDYQFMRPHSREKRQDRQRTAWGQTLGSVQDVINVFVRYCQGGLPTRSLLSQ